MKRTWLGALSVRAGFVFVALLAAGCHSGAEAPAKTGELSEEEIQQVKELDEQRSEEWGGTK